MTAKHGSPVLGICLISLFIPVAYPQQPTAATADQRPSGQGDGATSAATPEKEELPVPTNKRIFYIIPNYRTYPTLREYKPITPGEKFHIAVQDSFDRGTVILAAAFAGEGQLSNATPAFGQGVAGYARYFAASYGDLVIGDFMTEAIYPTILHQDPRYFRRGTGSGLSRAAYAMGQIFWTHRDSGGSGFNFAEIGGNATAVAISNAYYPDNRNVGNGLTKLGIQVGIDMASNLLKEFWPDLDRKFSRKPSAAGR